MPAPHGVGEMLHARDHARRNPVTVLPGLMRMSALMVPSVTHVKAVPAMMPFGAAGAEVDDRRADAARHVTVAVPEPCRSSP